MTPSVALVCLLAVVSGAALHHRPRSLRVEAGGRVLGGQPVDICQFPWQVSVEYVEAHRCGASIVSPSWVMTNAWCIWGTDPVYYLLRVGTSTRESGGATYTATDLFWHEDFDSVMTDRDIGFFEISGSISFDDNIQAVSLATEALEVGSTVTVSGWGSLHPGEDYPEQLHAVNTTLIDRSSCNETYEGLITENMICAGEPEGGKDSCNGDKGGALVVGSTQYGIVSWGYGCFYPPYPGVYTDVVALRSWINQTIGV